MTDIVTMTTAVLKKPYKAIIRRTGTTRSNMIKSFEKRVTMRPIGFESKKRMLARRTRYVITLCRLVALFKTILKITRDLTIVITMKKAIMMLKTIGYLDSYYASRSLSSHMVSQIEGAS